MDLSTVTSWWTDKTPAQRQWLERGLWILACLLCFALGRCTSTAPMVEEKTRVHETGVEQTTWAATEKVRGEYEAKLAETRSELDSWKTKATKKTVEIREPVLLICPRVPGQPDQKPVVATKTTIMTNTTSDKEGSKTDGVKTDLTVTSTTDAVKGETKTEVRYVDRVVEKEVKTYRPNDWSVGIMVGGQVPTPLLPIAGPLVLGVEGKRRIFSIGAVSVYGGAWVLTGFSAGGSVSVSF